MYKRPELDKKKFRSFIDFTFRQKFPEMRNTPALDAMVDEELKNGIRYFYQLQCERKLIDKYNHRFANYVAHGMIENLPEELYPNIEEWLDDREISEIPYGDLSIKRIMHWHKTRDGEPIVHPFTESAKAMGLYVKNGCNSIYDAISYFWELT